MSHTVEQNELVAEAVAGDRVSLERLLLIYYSPLSRRIAAKLPPTVRGAVAADDVLQQTFIQVFRDIGSFRPRVGASFWSWLKTIADHRVYDAVRTARRKKRGGDAARVELHADDDSIADLIEMLSTGGRSPSQSAASHEAAQAIRIAIAELPDDQRRAVQLRCLDGQSLAEVAAALDRSPTAVRGLLHRAKQQLREVLGRSSLWLSNK